ncbi:MAG: non-heme iron oxygenase ferredoxin subunit [Planctomycetia bacterium]|nr:non-heme iron oxygenase ferredoxin subunit [Planctomycetia bacterium]
MSKTVKIAEVNDVEPGEGKTVEADGQAVALFNVDGVFYAIDNTCTHVGGPLGEGALVGKEVTCPWHGAQFDVTCGKRLGGPARGDAKSFPVSVVGNDVFVEFE